MLARQARAVTWVVLLCLLLLASSQAGRAADPLGYTVEIANSGNDELDAAAQTTSALASLRDSEPIAPLALIARARQDAERMRAAMASLGLYRGSVDIRIAGRDLQDPALPDLLAALPAGQATTVAVAMAPGPPTTLRRIALTGTVPDFLGTAPKPAAGDIARADTILAARDTLRATLRARGYALAVVAAPDALLDADAAQMDISYAISPGPQLALGPITFSGMERMEEAALRRRLAIHPGQPFSPAALEKARLDLARLPPLAGVRIDEATTPDADGSLPVTFVVTERKPRAVELGASFATDQGGSVSAAWTHRNLFGGGERLALRTAVTELGGSAIRAPGFLLDGQYSLPDFMARDQSLTFGLGARREYLRAYDRDAILAAATLRRRFTEQVTVSAGLAAQQARIRQEAATRDYTLLQVPVSLSWDSTTSPLNPSSGWRAGVTLTPSTSLGPAGAQLFLVAQANASAYFDLAAIPGHSVLAIRALVGLTEGAGRADLPPDQRFYGGGSATIRGYRFQSVGPSFASGRPAGGTAIDTASMELRQHIAGSWGAVAFVDAGQVSDSATPFTGSLRVGAGLGVRYSSPIGPVRLDAAVPLIRAPGASSFQVYVGIGQAF